MQALMAALLCLSDGGSQPVAFSDPLSEAQLSAVAGSGRVADARYDPTGAVAISASPAGGGDAFAGISSVIVNAGGASVSQAQTSVSMNLDLNLPAGS